MLLDECDANFIGHTHPTQVNRVLCSSRAEQFAKHRMFPDEVVLCGPESAFVPYVSPGLPLAQGIQSSVRDYIARNHEPPKIVLLANHGLIAYWSDSVRGIQSHTDVCQSSHYICWRV